MTNEPEIPESGAEAAAEAMLYGTIFNELTRMLYSAPTARERARLAMEDFRESRMVARLKSGETKQ